MSIGRWDEFKLERFILDLISRGVLSVVSALPTNPVDTQEILYLADDANGVVWHLKYRAKSASSYKWEFVGGSPLFAEVVASESTASTTYVALTTAGPSIALPLGGDYMVDLRCGIFNATPAATGRMSYDIGGTGAVDGDSVAFLQDNVNGDAYSMDSAERRKNGLGVVTLTAKYRVTAGTGFFDRRTMKVKPVRVG